MNNLIIAGMNAAQPAVGKWIGSFLLVSEGTDAYGGAYFLGVDATPFTTAYTKNWGPYGELTGAGLFDDGIYNTSRMPSDEDYYARSWANYNDILGITGTSFAYIPAANELFTLVNPTDPAHLILDAYGQISWATNTVLWSSTELQEGGASYQAYTYQWNSGAISQTRAKNLYRNVLVCKRFYK
jgi:hypothetical protein